MNVNLSKGIGREKSTIEKYFSLFFYLQSISSQSFLTKIEIRLRYRKISTMMFLSIKRSLLPPRITMERLLCVILSFAEILTCFWSNLYKADTCLKRTHWVGPYVSAIHRFHCNCKVCIRNLKCKF